MSRYYTGAWSMNVEREFIDVTSAYPSPDPEWTYTDRAGHKHYYEKGYPTLTYVIDESHWCDGGEGIALHDPHEQVDESHYECGECGEVIEPGELPAGYPRSIPGSVRATLTGPFRDLRVTVDVVDAPEELWRRLMMTTTPAIRDRICEQYVEAHPDAIRKWSTL